MTRGGGDRAALVRMVGRDLDVLVRDRSDHGLLAHEGLGHQRGALDHLAHVVGERLGKARADARRRGEVDVPAAPGDDHVRTQVEELQERVHAGYGDDACGAVYLLGLEVRKAAEPGDLLPRGHLALQIAPVHLGIEIAELELRDAVLDRQLLDDPDEIVHAAVAAGVPGRADDERDAALARGGQKQLQLLAREMPEGDVLAQVDRAGIRAAAVGDDVVRTGLHAEMKALRAGGRRSEMSRRDEHAQATLARHGGYLLLAVGYGHQAYSL